MTKKKRHEPTGPFAPPTPSEADQREGFPMAAASDEDAGMISFVPTTQNADQYDPRVAQRHRDPQITKPPRGAGTPTPHGQRVEERHDENRAAESPPGYAPVDENGWRRLQDEDEPQARVNLPREERARGMTDDEDEAL